MGSISLAHRLFDEPFSHGFWVSAPRRQSFALMAKTLNRFALNLTVVLPLGGGWVRSHTIITGAWAALV